jgi:hypothetical protein
MRMIICSDFHQWFSFSIKFVVCKQRRAFLGAARDKSWTAMLLCHINKIMFYDWFFNPYRSHTPKPRNIIIKKSWNILKIPFVRCMRKSLGNVGGSLLNHFFSSWQITKMHLISFGWCFTGFYFRGKVDGALSVIWLSSGALEREGRAQNHHEKRVWMLWRGWKLAKESREDDSGRFNA